MKLNLTLRASYLPKKISEKAQDSFFVENKRIKNEKDKKIK